MTDDMPFSCSVCSKNFSSKKNLKNHSYIHAETEETCECGKVFANKIKLRNHRRTHGEREKAGVIKGHSCKIGNACFTGTLKKLNPNLLRKVQF